MKNNTPLLVGLTALAVTLCLACVCVAGISGFTFYTFSQNPEIDAIITEFSATATPTPAPKMNRDPLVLPPEAPSTEVLLAETDIPMRDLRQLASRLKYNGQDLPLVVNDQSPVFNIGDQRDFWLSDDSGPTPKQFQSTATLQYITDHTYWWVENGYTVNPQDLEQSAAVFESQTYPTNHEFFGSEWTPGVDNDPHLSIFLGNVPGVGGYYASLNEFSTEVNPYSNEQEIFFINLNVLRPGNEDFDGVLAHEFQHMIHWYQDRNETTWVNEGLSELATHLNGFDVGNNYNLYLHQPDLQLNAWGNSSSTSLPHYGSSYLFMAYFLEQFGEEMVKQLVANPRNGIEGFNHTLADAGYSQTFDDVFADFIVANYLNNTDVADGKWGYTELSTRKPYIEVTHAEPVRYHETTVHQYGADYIALDFAPPFTVHFTGSTVTSLVDNQAFSGQYQWYSNRADDSNATLTRAFDLRNVSAATLSYQTWFDIEEDWDYAYVEVSADGGKSWQIIEAPGTRNTNPSGNAYGPGYTGTSTGWMQETVDLSPFAGQEILLRFEYITDDAINGPGFTVDDIRIAEIGYFDDMESPDSDWVAEGFIRTNNLLAQRYTVQLIETGGDQPAVTRMSLDETNTGQLTVDSATGGDFVLVVSAHAPLTTEVSTYSYKVE